MKKIKVALMSVAIVGGYVGMATLVLDMLAGFSAPAAADEIVTANKTIVREHNRKIATGLSGQIELSDTKKQRGLVSKIVDGVAPVSKYNFDPQTEYILDRGY